MKQKFKTFIKNAIEKKYTKKRFNNFTCFRKIENDYIFDCFGKLTDLPCKFTFKFTMSFECLKYKKIISVIDSKSNGEGYVFLSNNYFFDYELDLEKSKNKFTIDFDEVENKEHSHIYNLEKIILQHAKNSFSYSAVDQINHLAALVWLGKVEILHDYWDASRRGVRSNFAPMVTDAMIENAYCLALEKPVQI